MIPLFQKLRQAPRAGDLPSSSQPTSSSSRPWETSHDAFLAWGANKAIRETTNGRDGKAAQDAAAVAEYVKGMDEDAMDESV